MSAILLLLGLPWAAKSSPRVKPEMTIGLPKGDTYEPSFSPFSFGMLMHVDFSSSIL